MRVAHILKPGRLLRRLRLGPRLVVLFTVPAVALLTIITMVVVDQYKDVQRVQTFDATLTTSGRLFDLIPTLQHERSLAIDAQSTTEYASAINTTEVADEAAGRPLGGSLARVRTLSVEQRQRESAYDEAIDELLRRLLVDLVTAAPSGQLALGAETLVELEQATELAMREELAVRSGALDDVARAETIMSIHDSETKSLNRVLQVAPGDIAADLRDLMVGDIWSAAMSLRRQADVIDPQEWAEVAALRIAELDRLTERHQRTLNVLTRQAADASERTVAVSIGIAAIASILIIASCMSLRRSILGPIEQMRFALVALVEGSLQVRQVTAQDEMGELEQELNDLDRMFQAFSEDSRRVRTRFGEGDLSARLTTTDYHGFWAESSLMLNGLLDQMETSAVHAQRVSMLRAQNNRIDNASMHVSGPDFIRVVQQAFAELEPHCAISVAVVDGAPLCDGYVATMMHEVMHFDGDRLVEDTSEAKPGRTDQVLARRVEGADGSAFALVATSHRPWIDVSTAEQLLDVAAKRLTAANYRTHAESELQFQRTHDVTTGLPNAQAFSAWLQERGQQHETARWALVVSPSDIGLVEAAHGLAGIDSLIAAIAGRLSALVDDYGMLARVSSNGFAISSSARPVGDFIREVLASFEAPFAVGGERLTVEPAVGYAVDAQGVGELLAAATSACRQSAARQDIAAVAYHPAMRTAAARRIELRGWLERSLAEESLEVWYQPITATRSGRVVAYEALCRGARNGEMVSPGEFIPVAEESGLIADLGYFVLERAIADLARLPGVRPQISVNVSPLQLQEPRLVHRIQQLLRDHQVDPSRLIIEITEGAVVSSDGEALPRLEALAADGIALAIDDFGTGYSSLGYLATLPVSSVKLDMSLVAPIDRQASSAAIVAHTVELAHDLGLTVVAEGVERDAQQALLQACGCERIQGYLTGRPQPLLQLLESSAVLRLDEAASPSTKADA